MWLLDWHVPPDAVPIVSCRHAPKQAWQYGPDPIVQLRACQACATKTVTRATAYILRALQQAPRPIGPTLPPALRHLGAPMLYTWPRW